MVYFGEIFVRWKRAATVIPSLKYLYVYCHHCTAVSNNHSIKLSNHCNATGIKRKNAFSISPVKLNKAWNKDAKVFKSNNTHFGKCHDHSLLNISSLKCYGQNSERIKAKETFLKSCKHCNSSNVKTVLDDSFMKKLVFGECLPIPLVHFPIDNYNRPRNKHEVPLPHQYNSTKVDNEKQPADDPNQKIRLLTEKLRIEAPMLLAKTNPYHDFTIYTNDVALIVENAPNKAKLILRGTTKYKFSVASFRRFLKTWMVDTELEVIGIRTNESRKTIELRWRVVGWTRWSLLSTYLLHFPASKSYLDYVSTFHVNDDGLIWRHEVTKMQLFSDSVPIGEKFRNVAQNAMGSFANVKSCFNGDCGRRRGTQSLK